MKLPVYITLAAIIGITTMPSASAQGARFIFSPNKWKEAAKSKQGFEPQHNVQAGSVPTQDILGVDPVMLAKPQPQAQQLPTALTRVIPQLMIPKTHANTNFNPAFGKPTLAQLPAPTIPQRAVALPGAPIIPAAAQPAQAAKPAVRTSVQGHLVKPKLRSTKPAMAVPAIASYPTNFGYVPGQILTHASSGRSQRATTQVRAQLLHKTQNQ